MNTIEIAPSWELLKKSDEDTKHLDPRNTEQWGEHHELLNWNVSTEVVDKVISKSLVTGTNQVLEQTW